MFIFTVSSNILYFSFLPPKEKYTNLGELKKALSLIFEVGTYVIPSPAA